jgi:hypothetical protein
MPTVVDRSRISVRSPGRRMPRVIVAPSRVITDQHTVPTGFSSVPPSGPAIPVIATAASAPKRSIAPAAIASATAPETAPCSSISAGSTPRSCCFASFEYATTPPAM